MGGGQGRQKTVSLPTPRKCGGCSRILCERIKNEGKSGISWPPLESPCIHPLLNSYQTRTACQILCTHKGSGEQVLVMT